jgi:hypothetical protein
VDQEAGGSSPPSCTKPLAEISGLFPIKPETAADQGRRGATGSLFPAAGAMQAIAIGLSKARRKGKKVPKKK